MLQVTYINRANRENYFSIEGIFDMVKNQLKNKIEILDYYYDAKLSRIGNVKEVGKHSGQINHITGDINFLAIGLKGKKNILTIHDFGHYEILRKKSFLKFLLLRLFWFKYPLKYVKIVTVVSEFTKRKLVRYFNFPEDKIRVIYNPIKPIFKFQAKPVVDKFVILQIGTGPHKNLNSLIEAAKEINVHIDIIGWPDEMCIAKLKQYNISYTIYNKLSDEKVYERYKACDILFFASFHEGFGMPIIEAQAIGRPVITSNIDAMIEVAGDSAVLVDPNSVEEIRKAITVLNEDRSYYDKIVDSGLINAEKFSPSAIADDYYNVYKELSTVN